jgi:mono/diheme cytochrome c family protein
MSSDATLRWCGLAAGALAGALALASCADFSRGEPSPAATDAGERPDGGDAAAPDGAALSFATDVYPLLVPTCQACHATGEQAGDTQLLFTGDAPADYATVVTFVDTSAPAGSRLLSKLSGNGHQGARCTPRIARVPDHPVH